MLRARAGGTGLGLAARGSGVLNPRHIAEADDGEMTRMEAR